MAKVTFVIEDGYAYAQTGGLCFLNLTADPAMGMITLHVAVPNADRMLLPGMYAHARLEQVVDKRATMALQQAMTRSPSDISVMAVDEKGMAAVCQVQVDRLTDMEWIISNGLKAGGKAIVGGPQKVRLGAPIKVTPR